MLNEFLFERRFDRTPDGWIFRGLVALPWRMRPIVVNDAQKAELMQAAPKLGPWVLLLGLTALIGPALVATSLASFVAIVGRGPQGSEISLFAWGVAAFLVLLQVIATYATAWQLEAPLRKKLAELDLEIGSVPPRPPIGAVLSSPAPWTIGFGLMRWPTISAISYAPSPRPSRSRIGR